jgi:hypothetical protein
MDKETLQKIHQEAMNNSLDTSPRWKALWRQLAFAASMLVKEIEYEEKREFKQGETGHED